MQETRIPGKHIPVTPQDKIKFPSTHFDISEYVQFVDHWHAIPEQPLHTNYLIIESNPPPIIPHTLKE